MGDRANFGFQQGEDTIYLYGHWAGEGMLKTLANALKGAERRWGDVAYGTRWTISNIIGNDWSQEYGWGLTANAFCDNEHSVPVVDFEAGTVTLYKQEWGDRVLDDMNVAFIMPIDKFVDKFGG